jgi:regulator of protease activity HflC (stomatin/prohibitin superfamily)
MVVAQAIAGNGVQATNYFLGTKYVEALSKMGSSSNAKVFFLPVEAAGVMASIAGIGELAKEAQARGAEAASRPRGSVPNAG